MPEQTPLEIAACEWLAGTYKGQVTKVPSDVGRLVFVHMNGVQHAIEMKRMRYIDPHRGTRVEFRAGLHSQFGLFLTDAVRVTIHALAD